MAHKFIVGGNWKMNGNSGECHKWCDQLNALQWNQDVTTVVVAAPAPYLPLVASLLKKANVAAQNCYCEANGAFTGEISPAMLVDLNVKWVILGHSERRNVFGETDQLVACKIAFAIKHGLCVIACVGEKLDEREADRTQEVLERQLSAFRKEFGNLENVVIAYEPVWAIGTGKVATPQQAQEAHALIRQWISKNYSQEMSEKMRIIYGGSVNAKNCKDLAQQTDVDGFLVGGASLKPEFDQIILSMETTRKL